MSAFDSVVVVDWSSGNDTGPTPKADAIWAGSVIGGQERAPVYLRNRALAADWLDALIRTEAAAGRRLLIGFDFPFGYPAGTARAVTESDDPLALWSWLGDNVEDAPKRNNRFALAGRMNGAFGGGDGPFWFNGLPKTDITGLPRTKPAWRDDWPAEKRVAETRTTGAFTCWQMGGAGAVGGQAMLGIAALEHLRRRHPGRIAVWPFEPLDRPVALVEVWPSLIADAVKAEGDSIKDRAQVRLLARRIAALTPERLTAMLDVSQPEEGWILGLGFETDLNGATGLANDCFALPPGVDWTPVDDALDRLRTGLSPVVGTETRATDAADGRILATDAIAARANPPAANSAVDGYGFAHAAAGTGALDLPLSDGRAAAGAAYTDAVPTGHALRILTGALLPDGVDTVILDEDSTVTDGRLTAAAPPKPGANTRKAGEDVAAAAVALPSGTRIGPSERALLAATGITRVTVHRPLRVGVLSTGDELAAPGETDDPARTYDANRPMLLSLLADWRMDPVDLGRIPDDRDALRAALDDGAGRADAILISGGASAGDEDHVSALLGETGARTDWRIALKPGRPLALGVWSGTPVFGLPGNPVAALVCTLIFARPALGLLGGEGWRTPTAVTVPAAFEKRKKPGRREYLRARLTPEGHAEVFGSEGSGRISGLAWSDGLVELDDGARHVRPGDPVRYLPYAAFR